MAMFPCSVCGRIYPGRQQTAYLNLVQGADSIGGKQRLCPTHFTVVYDLLETTCDLTLVGDDIQEINPAREVRCVMCDEESCETTLFAHLYPAKAERRSYMGSLCKVCTGTTQERLKIAS